MVAWFDTRGIALTDTHAAVGLGGVHDKDGTPSVLCFEKAVRAVQLGLVYVSGEDVVAAQDAYLKTIADSGLPERRRDDDDGADSDSDSDEHHLPRCAAGAACIAAVAADGAPVRCAGTCARSFHLCCVVARSDMIGLCVECATTSPHQAARAEQGGDSESESEGDVPAAKPVNRPQMHAIIVDEPARSDVEILDIRTAEVMAHALELHANRSWQPVDSALQHIVPLLRAAGHIVPDAMLRVATPGIGASLRCAMQFRRLAWVAHLAVG